MNVRIAQKLSIVHLLVRPSPYISVGLDFTVHQGKQFLIKYVQLPFIVPMQLRYLYSVLQDCTLKLMGKHNVVLASQGFIACQ